MFCARRLPVPNMIADLDQAPKERAEKPVWRVAFFGRLEERKGIKLFVDAVQVCWGVFLWGWLPFSCSVHYALNRNFSY